VAPGSSNSDCRSSAPTQEQVSGRGGGQHLRFASSAHALLAGRRRATANGRGIARRAHHTKQRRSGRSTPGASLAA
jgi:hypothetical protein